MICIQIHLTTTTKKSAVTTNNDSFNDCGVAKVTLGLRFEICCLQVEPQSINQDWLFDNSPPLFAASGQLL